MSDFNIEIIPKTKIIKLKKQIKNPTRKMKKTKLLQIRKKIQKQNLKHN